VSSRLTIGCEGKARARCREVAGGGREGAALAKAFCPTRQAGGKLKAKIVATRSGGLPQ